MGGKLYGLCGVDPQYCPPGKENFVKSLKRYEINKVACQSTASHYEFAS